MDRKVFLNLPTEEVAQIVQEAGPKVCVFPINGTRRWFMIEHPQQAEKNLISNYLDIAGKRHIELYQLFFDHGLNTLLTPVFGPDLLKRGESYTQAIGAEGLARLATHHDFLTFYEDYDVRVRFYGDYHKALSTPYSYLSELFERVTVKTQSNNKNRLFFGVFAHDATETIAELSIDYHTKYKRMPDKKTIVELYYGEYVPSVSIFIGFDKLCAFDMPLIATGNEDLYFTIAPSPYLSAKQLRYILYDHLYARPEEETGYKDMNSEDWELMRKFYQINQNRTIGIGRKQKRGRYWYPLSQVRLPTDFADPFPEPSQDK